MSDIQARVKCDKRKLGDSSSTPNPEPEDGFSVWIESGVWYTAPTVSDDFGGHSYDNGGFENGARDCECGCFMLGSSSGGEVDPFGQCPENPKPAPQMSGSKFDYSKFCTSCEKLQEENKELEQSITSFQECEIEYDKAQIENKALRENNRYYIDKVFAIEQSRDELLEVYKEHRWDMCRLGVDEDLIKKVESQKNGETNRPE